MFKRIWMTLLVAMCAFSASFAQSVTKPVTTSATRAAITSMETIVIIRHGEKAPSGQLSIQGFNRAIALSDVLPRKFGQPVALFAPDPSEKKEESTGFENYVRPLATIEPTAIKLGMPVQTPCGFRNDDEMVDLLSKPQYRNGTIIVAWEHKNGEQIATGLMSRFGGDASAVPKWEKTDFDSIYVVIISRTANGATARFQRDREGLDNQSLTMPVPSVAR